jgi:peptidoglycan/xylan/chitin deacetylase (PgdA/CDA1 family)
MHYLRKNFRCLRFDEDWSGLQGPAVVVTFDDGYADNLYQALPIIAEAGVPATFFISTGTLGTRMEFWSDEIEYLILGEGNRPIRFALQDEEYRHDWPATSREERLALHRALHSLMLKISAHRREDWLDQLRRWASLDRAGRDAYRSLTREELQELAASPWVTIGAHGVTHTPLAVLDELGQSQEISLSKQVLEDMLNRKIDFFSYPFGGHRQYDATTRRLCRVAGFRHAVTTLPGQVHRWTDPFQLPRQMVRDWDVQTFAARLENFWI